MKSRNFLRLKAMLLATITTGLFSSLISQPLTNLSDAKLIPQPVSVTPTLKTFELTKNSKIIMDLATENISPIASYLSNILKPATGFNFTILEATQNSKGCIFLTINRVDSTLGDEGYQLEITKKNITLSAYKPAGLLRGIQTLRQLLPPSIERDTVQAVNWQIPTGTIRDFPRFKHRGAMLDVARHFFGVNDVKRFIDLLCYYKINTFHWHLTDDQGWRIEIKSWPNLTTIAGNSAVNGDKGGYYTQTEYSEIVKYAAERYITIIPEIDMPGHTNAALASYSELNANDTSTKLYTGIDVGFSSLAIHKEITYQFIDDVIRELAAISPGAYIHIGGDESHATPHDDYIYFINRVLKIAEKYGKIPIGWDEIANAEIQQNTIIQFWANIENTSLGISKGAKVILSPAKYVYMDMKYDSTTLLGGDWAGVIEVDKAYNWYNDSLIKSIPENCILGIESPLWTEFVKTMSDIEFLTFPRLAGYAEIGWSQENDLNWENYKKRLAAHKLKFEAMEINYYKSPKVDW